MVYLLLAVCCSLAIGVIFKICGGLKVDRFQLLTVNYLCAAGLALGLSGFKLEEWNVDVGVAMGVGVLLGVLFIVTFALYSLATEASGLAIATSVARISLVVPFVFSWLYWHESPGTLQLAGLPCAIVSLVLLSATRRSVVALEPRATYMSAVTLLSLFVAAGATDTSLKLFEESFSGIVSRPAFLFAVFASASIVGGFIIMSRRKRVDRKTGRLALIYGVVLGLVNFGSVEFFLEALSRLPGTVAFPFNHVAIVLGGTILGVAVWSESLNRYNLLGLALAAAALALLTA
ncbi:MAG: hypothetical protein KJO98_12250 [Rhodothermia bacterium]|nr:hypothetical protein [Rhodothermia bacterium]